MATHKDDLNYWLALLRTPGVGAITSARLLQAFGSASAIFAASRSQLQEAGVRNESVDFILQPNWDCIAPDLAWLDQPNAQVVALDNPAYPYLLKEISDPPPVLFNLWRSRRTQPAATGRGW